MKRILLFLMIASLSVTGWAATCDPSEYEFGKYDVVQSKDRYPETNETPTDYFWLVYSWSPGFCDYMESKDGPMPAGLKFQCSSGIDFGWVLHGLWAQSATASDVEDHPRWCDGDLPLVDKDVIRPYVCMSPGARLLQGEWEKHGACDFDTAGEYYSKAHELHSELVFPQEEMKFKKLFKWMRANNPSLENVRLGRNGRELVICYNTDFEVMDCK